VLNNYKSVEVDFSVNNNQRNFKGKEYLLKTIKGFDNVGLAQVVGTPRKFLLLICRYNLSY
jgi:hypothetical protein